MGSKVAGVKSAEYYQRNLFDHGFRFIDFQTEVPDVAQEAGAKPFNLSIPVQSGWKNAETRILIVVQHVDSQDLKAHALCTHTYGTALGNVLNHSREWHRELSGTDTAYGAKLAVVNFNYARTYDLDDRLAQLMADCSAQRVRDAVNWLQPTHIVVLGDLAASAVRGVPLEQVYTERGWVHTWQGLPLVHTIDLGRCIGIDYGDDDDEDEDDAASDRTLVAKANLLGFISRQLLSLWFQRLPWSIRKIKARARFVNTMAKFRRMMAEINAANAVAFDSECSNLTVHRNRPLVFQFATRSDYGYVLPLDHPDTPWTPQELAEIKAELRAFFAQPIKLTTDFAQQRYLIGHTLKFDLRLIRHELGIPVIHWPVWDITAGQFCLDENLTALRAFGRPYGGLAQMCAHYGNSFYFTKSGFSKDDRANMDAVNLYDPTFHDYCAFDVQAPFEIHLRQQGEAEWQRMCATESYLDHYRKFVLTVMSNIVHDFSHMEQMGVTLDTDWLLTLMGAKSELLQRIETVKSEFLALPTVKEAARRMGRAKGVSERGLFGKIDPVFHIGKADYKLCLFFDVMKLKVVNVGKPSAKYPKGVPSIGKAFKSTYKKDHPEVALLDRLTKMEKLMSSYVTAFYQRMAESDDGKADGKLRPGFGFFDVVTGRSNSFRPSLQQMPTRTEEAKLIKRAFIAPPGHMLVKLDYSAHEVRCWAYAGQDENLGNLFKVGRRLRIQYMMTGDLDLPAKIKLEGDLHRINVARFFNIDLKTVDPETLELLRDQVKAIVFGSIYGRSVKSIAKATGMSLQDAQRVYDMFFKEYHVAGDWLTWARDSARTYLHTHSFIGRKRNLSGFLTGISSIIAANERQAMNSPIQGVGADIAHTANRVFTLEWDRVCRKFGWVTPTSRALPSYVEVMVHDSSRGQVPFAQMMAMMQVMNWSYTTGTELYLEQHFGVRLTCPLEVEFEVGPDESHMSKWDWSIDAPSKGSLTTIIKKSIADMVQHVHPDTDPDAAWSAIYGEWENSKVRRMLDKRYPWFPELLETSV